MSTKIQISCVTKHFFPETYQNYLKINAFINQNSIELENFTCCAYPLFQNGDIKTAKKIGEHHINSIKSKIVSCSNKCYSTFKNQYPKLYNNTVSHNAALDLANKTESFYHLISNLNLKNTSHFSGKYTLISDCENKTNINEFLKQFEQIEWIELNLNPTCCGAGACLPTQNKSLSVQMAIELINDSLSKSSNQFVFIDDVCRQHIIEVANKQKIDIKTFNLVDLIAISL